MTNGSTEAIVLARRFDWPTERVFEAWLNPDDARHFLFATPTGTLVRVDIDPRVDGAFNITRRDGEDVEHIGKYVEIDPPRRIVFVFGVPRFSLLTTRVSLDFTPLASGCELNLTHDGVPSEWIESARGGWSGILDSLAEHLASERGKSEIQ